MKIELGNVIGAGLNAIGGFLTNKSNQRNQNATNQMMMRFQSEQNDKNNAFNSAEAEKQRLWQERLSNTEVSRRLNDMRASGLNPAFQQMQDGSTPQGAQASANSLGSPSLGTQKNENPLSSVDALTASQIEVNKAQAENINAQTQQTKVETDWIPKLNESTIAINTSAIEVNGSEIELNESRKQEINSLINKANQEIDNMKESLNEIKARTANYEADTAIKKIDEAFESQLVQAKISEIASKAGLNVAQTTEIYKLLVYKQMDLFASASLKNVQTSGQVVVNTNGVFDLQLRANDMDLEKELHTYKVIIDNCGQVAGSLAGTFGGLHDALKRHLDKSTPKLKEPNGFSKTWDSYWNKHQKSWHR